MKTTSYFRPTSLKKALYVLSEQSDMFIIAGGTDLIIKKIRNTNEQIKLLDITDISEISRIKEKNDFITIGSTITISELVENKVIVKYFPALISAGMEVGSKQIRNIATIGGNIGNASPAGDMIPPLYVYSAILILSSIDGERKVKIDDFFLGPKSTILKKNEIIKEIVLPKIKKDKKTKIFSAFKKIGQRKALTISKVNSAIMITTQKGIIKDVKIAFGAVAPTVIFAHQTENKLINKKLSKQLIILRSSDILSQIRPIDDIRSNVYYRQEGAKSLFIEILSGFLHASHMA